MQRDRSLPTPIVATALAGVTGGVSPDVRCLRRGVFGVTAFFAVGFAGLATYAARHHGSQS